MSALLGRRRVVAAIILVLVAVVATESVVLAATTVRQGSVEYMKVASTPDFAGTSSTSWTDLPGTALAMTVPGGEHDFLQVTFTMLPACDHIAGVLYANCYFRLLVDGQVASPGATSVGNSEHPPFVGLPLTMQWLSPTVLAPGTHYVKVQWFLDGSGNQMSATGRTMTVIRARAY